VDAGVGLVGIAIFEDVEVGYVGVSTAAPSVARMKIAGDWRPDATVCLFHGDTRVFLPRLPNACTQLVITSPPYNIAKPYERTRRQTLDEYLDGQKPVIDECVRILRPGGSICWEVGNHVTSDGIVPLDIVLYPLFARHPGLRLRNRIVWHFEHGLHCSKRFSGRYEVILWFSKGEPSFFNLDPIRVPQKYPGKRAWKGNNVGQYTGNPLGKNPGDVWVFPNVKSNHIEKTIHPCQFPVELVERFVLALTEPGDLVVDPYLGVGTTACAAILHGRRAAGAEVVPEYVTITKERLELAARGALKTRPLTRPVHEPDPNSALARRDGEAPSKRSKLTRRSAAQGLRLTFKALGKNPSQGRPRDGSRQQLELLNRGQ
jgi:adenine-specific DNA-methyltransferase